MLIQRALQINLALLVVASTTFLGIASGDAWMPVWTLATVVAAVAAVDFGGRFRLNGIAANAAALGVVTIAAFDFGGQSGSVEQLVAIAKLPVYMQMVVLFQEKTPRVATQLVTLGLLEVVVGTALAVGASTGAFLVVYVALAVSAMTLIFIERESSHYGGEGFQSPPQRHSLLGQVRRALESSVARPKVPEKRGAVESKATLWATQRATATVVIGTLALAPVVFFLSPRMADPDAAWREPVRGVATGFINHVKLQSQGLPIIQDADIVMRVKFSDLATGKAYDVHGAIALRGTAAENYRDGAWTESRLAPDAPIALADAPRHTRVMEVDMAALENPTLFALYPVVNVRPNDRRLLYRPLQWRESRRGGSASYVVGTTGLDQGRQAPLVPSHGDVGDRFALLKMPKGDGFDEIAAIAREVVGDESLAPYEKAGKLEAWLRDSGEFQYSLDLPQRDENLDPTVDFLTQRRVGHCNYFASALAMMLRSQEIPSRLVLGYKSGEYNALGGYFQVRQMHAHSWVEAFLTADQIPEEIKAPGRDYSQGGWLRLDATPYGAELEFAESNQGFWRRISDVADHVDMLWHDYILSFNRRRQQAEVYEPIEDAWSTTVERAGDGESWRQMLGRLRNPFGFDLSSGIGFGRGVLLVVYYGILVATMIWFIYFVVSPLRRLRREWTSAKLARRGAPSTVAFQRRLETILSRHGWLRAAGQTQRELAAISGGEMAENPRHRASAPIPRRVVEAFYQVRFGGRELSEQQRQAIKRDLAQLEAALADRSTAP